MGGDHCSGRLRPCTLEQLHENLKSLGLRVDDGMKRPDDICPGPGCEAPEAYAW